MSLKFVFGPSGSGKSYQLYDYVIRESVKFPDRQYIVLVPEQFTMQTQKDLVMQHPNHGIMNIDVLSFVRLDIASLRRPVGRPFRCWMMRERI